MLAAGITILGETDHAVFVSVGIVMGARESCLYVASLSMQGCDLDRGISEFKMDFQPSKSFWIQYFE